MAQPRGGVDWEAVAKAIEEGRSHWVDANDGRSVYAYMTDAVLALIAPTTWAVQDDWATRFWSIVDGRGMLGVPSGEWSALSRLVDRAWELDALKTSSYGAVPLWRHNKRGSTYAEIGHAEVQSDTLIVEGMTVVVYRSEDDGKLWARPISEFEDGRFERFDRARLPTLRMSFSGAGPNPGFCLDCPPVGYPTDETRCSECPRSAAPPSPAAQDAER